MRAMQVRIKFWIEKVEQIDVLIAIKRGLIELLPVILTGAFSLILYSIPWEPYQHAILFWGNGILNAMFRGAYEVTFGLLAVYMAISMSYQYTILRGVQGGASRGAWVVTALACFFVLAGVPNHGVEPLSAKGIFTAIVAVVISVRLFEWVAKHIRWRESASDVLDVRMERALRLVVPTVVAISLFVVVNELIINAFDADSMYQLIKEGWGKVFERCPSDMAKSLLFVLISSFFWALGIHGSDILDSVVDQVFVPIREGYGSILTRPFLDNFILMGGCGTSICLLIAILLFAKRKSIRSMGRLAIIPAIFNVNEILVYGLPIIYNPYLLVPFFLIPLFCFGTTYLSMRLGLVPLPSHTMPWTMPVLISGYLVTGSVRGTLLQLFNIAVGTVMYLPFVRLHEKREVESAIRDYKCMVERLQAAEEKGETVCFTEDLTLFLTAKALIADLKKAIKEERLSIFYQPQVNHRGECIGAEALLRWKHASVGYVYPPLIMQLAEEGKFLAELEKGIVRKVIADALEFETVPQVAGRKVSFNITGQSIQNESFEKFLLRVAKHYKIKKLDICLELTEQAAIQMNEALIERFANLKEAGYTLAVDDFSMGSTSIKYLTGNNFSIVKLDGYLVRDIAENERCYEIISHIMALSKSLDAEIVAEYVSDKKVQEKLYEAGCTTYQGWLYAKPMTKEDYIAWSGNKE
ncbi:PTS system, lactose/cellobiose family IIC component [Lachnospiraceae bacterium XBB1006]|nr:PTS system, lactose/cellobiose family IIC component [Lachnospiraceae bacterium XBB1006]